MIGSVSLAWVKAYVGIHDNQEENVEAKRAVGNTGGVAVTEGGIIA